MQGGISYMTSTHCLEERQGFPPPHLTYDEILRPLAESRLEQLIHIDLALPFCIKRGACDAGYPVGMRQFQLPGVFKCHYLGKGGNKQRDGIERGCLS